MYKTKDLTQKDLDSIQIKNQAEIVEYIGSELDPKEAFELIKKESKDFTVANAKAEEADALLDALVTRKPIQKENVFEVYTMGDGTTWRILSKREAKKRFKDDKEVFAINRSEETEHLIETHQDFKRWDEFAMEYDPKQPDKEKNPNSLTNEQIRILKVKKEMELALLTIKLKRKKEVKQKRKSA